MAGYIQLTVVFVLAVLAFDSSQGETRKPPDVKVPNAPQTMYFMEKERVEIECRAEGTPTPTYQWRRNDVVIQSDSNVYFDSVTGKLVFSSFNSDNAGTYMCIAMNVAENMQSPASSFGPPIKLFMTEVGAFSPQDDTTMTLNEYSYGSMRCEGQGTAVGPDIVYKWYISEQTTEVPYDPRLFVDSEGTLHFVYTLRSDSTTNFEYLCGISSASGKLIRLGGKNFLQVTPVQSPTAIKPSVTYVSKGLTVERFNTAVLECVVSGYQPTQPHYPTIKWYDDAGVQITNSTQLRRSIQDNNRKLVITNVQESDEKSYYCEGETDVDRSGRAEVFLDVTSIPIFHEVNGAPKDQTVPEGPDASVTFYCDARSASSEPAPQPPIWYINGLKMGAHNNPTKYIHSNDDKELTIKGLDKTTDIVCVQCQVTNHRGTTWGDACLNVILPIRLTTEPDLVQEITKGDTIDLTIRATTDPSEKLSYRWEFKNETYDVKPPLAFYDSNDFVAYINTSGLTDEEYQSVAGVYHRVIYHPHETKSVSVEVVLKDSTIPVAVTSSGRFDMWIIGLIIGIIFLIIVIIIIILVICRKKQEGDYNVDKKETGAGLDPEKDLKDKDFDDYSRPDYVDYDYPDKKPRGDLEYDDVPIGGDDEESLGEYGDEEDTHFNEDGSFIGIYQKKAPNDKPAQATESTI